MNKKTIITVIIAAAVVIAAMGAGAYYYFNFVRNNQSSAEENYNEEEYTYPEISDEEIQDFDMSMLEKKKLPKNIKELSKKYTLFEDIYLSDKKVFVYGWERFEKPPLDEDFHKKMTKELKKGNYDDYKVVVLHEPERAVMESIKKHKIEINEDANCTNLTQQEKDLLTITELPQICYSRACIVDPAKNEYVHMPKHIKLISKILHEYK